MTTSWIEVALEVTPKKSFASALEWPGWSRSGRTAEDAVEALLAYADRYRVVARDAGETLPPGALEVAVVETADGDATTVFGAPSRSFAADRRPTTPADAARIIALVEAAWALFEQTASAAPRELRKGPRGGGRDTAKLVEHVVGAEQAYARQVGLRLRAPDPGDAAAIRAMRDEIAAVLAEPSDGSPLGRWSQRYAARRIAWHALDHAWEIEDRSAP